MQKIHNYLRENYQQKFLSSQFFFKTFTKNGKKYFEKPIFCKFNKFMNKGRNFNVFEPIIVDFFRKRGITNLTLKNVDSILLSKQRALTTIKTIYEDHSEKITF